MKLRFIVITVMLIGNLGLRGSSSSSSAYPSLPARQTPVDTSSSSSSSQTLAVMKAVSSAPLQLPIINQLPISLMHLIYLYCGVPQELRHLKQFEQVAPIGPDCANGCVYSPDHRYVATVENIPLFENISSLKVPHLVVFDTTTHTRVFEKEVTHNFLESSMHIYDHIAWSCDSRYLAYKEDFGAIIKWNIVAPLSGSPKTLASLSGISFSWSCSDNKRFAMDTLSTELSTSADRCEHGIIIYDLLDNKPVFISRFNNPPSIGYVGTRRCFSKLFWNPSKPILTVAYSCIPGNSSPRHEYVIIYDLTTGKSLYTIEPSFYGTRDIAFSPDGESMALARLSGIIIYDTLTGIEKSRYNNVPAIRSLAWPNKDTMYYSSVVSTIFMFNVANRSESMLTHESDTGKGSYLNYCADLNQLLVVPQDPRKKTTVWQQVVSLTNMKLLCGYETTPQQPALVSESSSSSSSSTTSPTPQFMASAFQYREIFEELAPSSTRETPEIKK